MSHYLTEQIHSLGRAKQISQVACFLEDLRKCWGETLPAGSHGYHTIIDRLDTKVGRLWVTLLGNLQPPPEPKNNEERVPSPSIICIHKTLHQQPIYSPSRLWSARTATRTGFPFILTSNIPPFMSSPPRRPHIPIRPAVVIVYCLIACLLIVCSNQPLEWMTEAIVLSYYEECRSCLCVCYQIQVSVSVFRYTAQNCARFVISR